ncbi:MAG: RDD family protein [Fimbriimonadaceae bacterium]|nr:RDD family protein [Fimbriimonadaceae bacterium]
MTDETPEIIDLEPQRLASIQARFGSALVTLFVGWVIWNLFTWKTGQTPAKRILKQVVVDAKTGEVFSWSRMALREFAVKGAAGNIASSATSGITFVIDSLFVFREDRRTVHDLIVGSKVIQI